MINFINLTLQEVELILAGLRKLPMEVVAEFHAKLHKDATEQFQSAQPQTAVVAQPETVSTESVA
jgi:hypothetical protein